MRRVVRWATVGAVLAVGAAGVGATIPHAAATPAAIPAAPGSLGDAQLVVGPARRVVGPTPDVDSNFASLPAVNGTMRGYVANINTFGLQGPDMQHLRADLTDPVIGYDPSRSAFDHCGAWLQGLWQGADPAHVLGWYHAETDCHSEPAHQTNPAYAAGTVLRSIGLVESTDGGRTFAKRGKVLWSATQPVSGRTVGEGNPTAVVKDGYLYLPFTEATPSQSVSMARASLAAGAPGAFGKYDGSGWTGAAKGDLGATVPGIGGGTASGLYSAGDQMVMVTSDAAHGGILLRYGGPTSWSPAVPLVPATSADTRSWGSINDTTRQMIAYPSVAAPTGGNSFGTSFFLLHMYLQPGGVLSSDRYLVRRHVTVEPRAAGDPSVLLALTRYRAAGDETATTSLAPEGYAEGERLGYVLTQQDAGTVPLLDCASGSDQYIATTSCPAGASVRTTGYVWSSQVAGSAPLYACTSASGDRFPSADPACEGAAQAGTVLGYFRASAGSAPQVALSGEVHDTTTSSDLTTTPGRAGIRVSLLGPDGQPARDVEGDPVAPVTTAADGLYSFARLPLLDADQHYTVQLDGLPSGTEATPSSHHWTTALLTADGDAQTTGLDFGVGPDTGASKPVITFSSPTTYGTPTTITVTKAGAADGETVHLTVGTVEDETLTLSHESASLTLLAKQAPGSYPVAATYGDRTATRTLVIAKATPRIAETFPTTVRRGARASGTVTVSVPGTAVVPPGRVEIQQGRAVLVAWVTLHDGRAAIRLPRLTPGRHALAVRYAGTSAIWARSQRFTITQR